MFRGWTPFLQFLLTKGEVQDPLFIPLQCLSTREGGARPLSLPLQFLLMRVRGCKIPLSPLAMSNREGARHSFPL